VIDVRFERSIVARSAHSCCVFRQDSTSCTELGATVFNVTSGVSPGTVIFTVVGGAPDAAIGLCVDYNAGSLFLAGLGTIYFVRLNAFMLLFRAGIDQLELYECYSYENQQQVIGCSFSPLPRLHMHRKTSFRA
jgi:hypothetical protein